jgi:hypothetical protein
MVFFGSALPKISAFFARGLILLRRRRRLRFGGVGQDDTVILEDALALVQGLQVGDIAVPLLALQRDRARLVAPEHRANLLFIRALDLGQRLEVFRNALVQLDRGERRVPGDQVEQRLHGFAERQAVGVVQALVRFDVIEQAADLVEAVRIARREQRGQGRVDLRDAQLVLVEQLLADAVGLLFRIGRECFFVQRQHDHLAVGVEQLAQVGCDGACRRRLGGARRRWLWRRGGLAVDQPGTAGGADGGNGEDNGEEKFAFHGRPLKDFILATIPLPCCPAPRKMPVLWRRRQQGRLMGGLATIVGVKFRKTTTRRYCHPGRGTWRTCPRAGWSAAR